MIDLMCDSGIVAVTATFWIIDGVGIRVEVTAVEIYRAVPPLACVGFILSCLYMVYFEIFALCLG